MTITRKLEPLLSMNLTISCVELVICYARRIALFATKVVFIEMIVFDVAKAIYIFKFIILEKSKIYRKWFELALKYVEHSLRYNTRQLEFVFVKIQ